MDAAVSEQPQIRVIDADTHYSEPHDLWLKRAPRKYIDRVPQVKTLNGRYSWYIDGDKPVGRHARANSAVTKDGRKATGDESERIGIDDCHPGCWDPKARLQFMDQTGVWAHVIYPNILGFGGHRSASVGPELRLVLVQIYNDAMAEMQQESGGRLYPMALLPWWDVKEAVKETERAAGMGLKGININPDPHSSKIVTGLPPLYNPYWDPLWEICQDKNLPVNFHLGASDQGEDFYGTSFWPGFDRGTRVVVGSAMMFFNNARILGNLLLCGLLDRFEKLNFVSVESGIGWIPFMLEALTYQKAEYVDKIRHKLTPKEYFARNFYATYWFEQENLVADIHRVGVDRVMFETDFPHPTCFYPAPDFTGGVPGLTYEESKKVLSANAARVYSIEL